jgi:haloalkane dehalogenase
MKKMIPQQPLWLDKNDYPFESNYFETDLGRIHYVDEGQGTPIVMTHGNPTWSYLYRNPIKELSKDYRCIAVDNLGFGLSDKPYNCDYEPRLHALNLEKLVEHLGLSDIMLMVHDWGGPIGLSYAYNHPDNVQKIIIANTWSWPVKGDKYYEGFSRFMGGPIGRFLIKNFNIFVHGVMKQATANKKVLTKEVMKHYSKPLAKSKDRKACWTFPKQIIESTAWLEGIWSKRDNIASHPILILWGGKDIAFRQQELEKWKSALNSYQLEFMPDTGHYVYEEQHAHLIPIIRRFFA